MKKFKNIKDFKKFLLSEGIKKSTIRIEDCELSSFEFIGEKILVIPHKNSKIIHFLAKSNIYFSFTELSIKNYTLDSVSTHYYQKDYSRPNYYPNKNQIGYSIYLKKISLDNTKP